MPPMDAVIKGIIEAHDEVASMLADINKTGPEPEEYPEKEKTSMLNLIFRFVMLRLLEIVVFTAIVFLVAISFFPFN